jgi:hypothetical protein
MADQKDDQIARSLRVSPAEGRTSLTEQWRQAVYPHVEEEMFARYLADETAKGWDDVRVEVAALHAIVAAALVLRPSEDWQPTIDRARRATDQLRDAAREGRVIHFRQRDDLVMAIHEALDALEAK